MNFPALPLLAAETFNTVTESKTFQRSEEPSAAADKIEVLQSPVAPTLPPFFSAPSFARGA